MTRRPHVSLSVKLAGTLLQLRDENGEPLIPYEHAKLMTADQIISLFQFDHYPICHDDGGPAEPWNIVPRPIMAHRRKTAKKDIPEMRKADRITAAQAEFQRRMLAPAAERKAERKSKWPSRPMRRRER